jgi:acetate kinase
MPKKAYLYGLPLTYYKKYKVRRYGFHGTSHDFVSKRAAEILGKKAEDLKIIVCHLGNGASVSAVKNGKSVDTSMGLTPLEGLIMGTRSGDLDPAIITFLAEKEGISAEEVINICNKKSGVLGLSDGLSSDFRDLGTAVAEGNEAAKDALDAYAYRVAKYIGAYAAAMNGVDVIVFTAGVGENNAEARAMIGEYLGYLGTNINPEKNKLRGEEVILSDAGAKVTTMVIPTNEELAIARETVRLVQG